MHVSALGFIGLGVMGGPMCRNLTSKTELPVTAYDPASTALDGAVEFGASRGDDVEDVAARADIIFLSLPSIVQVKEVVEQILAAPHQPQAIVDMSTSDVKDTQELGRRLEQVGIIFVDAPVARLRQAAIDGTLLITVGATKRVYEILEPFLTCMGSDVVHTGPLGSGQVTKIINNMVVFQNMNALAEALAIGRSAGVDGKVLFETLQLGSAESFQLRRAAMDTLVLDDFPEKRFPTTYAIKDLALALALAAEGGIEAPGAQQTMALLEATRDAGYANNYYPVMIRMLNGTERHANDGT